MKENPWVYFRGHHSIELKKIRDKFGNIHKEARNKIGVKIEGQLSITIRNDQGKSEIFF